MHEAAIHRKGASLARRQVVTSPVSSHRTRTRLLSIDPIMTPVTSFECTHLSADE
jgi:hypothetical protein